MVQFSTRSSLPKAATAEPHEVLQVVAREEDLFGNLRPRFLNVSASEDIVDKMRTQVELISEYKTQKYSNEVPQRLVQRTDVTKELQNIVVLPRVSFEIVR